MWPFEQRPRRLGDYPCLRENLTNSVQGLEAGILPRLVQAVLRRVTALVACR